MKIAILSNINMDLIEDYLRDRFEEIFKSNFNQYQQDLLDENSILSKKDFDIIFLHLDGEEFLKDYLSQIVGLGKIQHEIDDRIESLFVAIKHLLSRKNKSLFIFSNLSIPPYTFNGLLERNSEYSFNEIKDYINNKIYNFRKNFPNILILDWERILDTHGYHTLYTYKYWYIGRIKYTDIAFEQISKEIGCLVDGYYGKSKKVIVLDLDNTLWGGVIGEDGVGGISLSQDGIAKAFYDFQQILKSIKSLGISLAICSKNNIDDVNEVFLNHPMMLLKYDDFVSIKVNWEDKVRNISDIASDLNLSIDSFIFIDDNPFERQLVKKALPEVVTPNFPQDPADIPIWFLSEVLMPYFPKIIVTEEDKYKTKQYLVNLQRKRLSEKYDVADFMKSLDIKLKVYINDKRFIERTAQMTQKTNQFNLTTKRYTTSDVQAFIDSGNHYIFSLEYEDKFGKEGIVGTAILEVYSKEAFIDSFLLSCRVIGRNIEFNLLNAIAKFLAANHKNIDILHAYYLETKKNSLVSEFYERAGFDIKEKIENGHGKKYAKSPVDLIKSLNAVLRDEIDNTKYRL